MNDPKVHALFYLHMPLFGEVLLYFSVSECLLQEKKSMHLLLVKLVTLS